MKLVLGIIAGVLFSGVVLFRIYHWSYKQEGCLGELKVLAAVIVLCGLAYLIANIS